MIDSKMIFLKWFLKILGKLIAAVIIVVVVLLVVFNWPVRDKNENMQFNLSFSSVFARDIGLDWKRAYVDILDNLKPEKVRIASYWTEVEKKPGNYDFSDVDFQLQEAKKRNTKVVLAFGVKTPRWPECFIPEFYGGNNGTLEGLSEGELMEKRETALLEYERKLIERYRDEEIIEFWQVENEPFLPFGNCPKGTINNGELLDREIAQLRFVDKERQRKVMVTDSGELSLWLKAAKRANIFGTTLYRTIYKKPFGYVNYPIGPMFFRMKSWPIRIFGPQNQIVICELQAEPWGPRWLTDMDVQEQFKSMNPRKLQETAEFARKTNFSESYLWGAEWWYWLKEEQGDDGMWEEAKKIIQNQT